MMNILFFIITVIVSFLIVRIGAIAFEITGLEWSIAKFQAMSCFSSTGFTTKESELITGNMQRRKIATFLMILGNAGLVTLIATFANSIRSSKPFFHIPYLSTFLSVGLMNIIIIVLATILLLRIFGHHNFDKKITKFLRRKIIKRRNIKSALFTNFYPFLDGHGVFQIDIHRAFLTHYNITHIKDLQELQIIPLGIKKDNQTELDPKKNIELNEGDQLVCFASIENIQKLSTG